MADVKAPFLTFFAGTTYINIERRFLDPSFTKAAEAPKQISKKRRILMSEMPELTKILLVMLITTALTAVLLTVKYFIRKGTYLSESDDICSKSGNGSEKGDQAEKTDNNMVEITMKIDGMACGMCEAHVNEAIRNAFHVKKVTSSHAKKECVILSENNIDEEALKKVISDTGYTVLSVSAKPAEKHGGFLGLFRK